MWNNFHKYFLLFRCDIIVSEQARAREKKKEKLTWESEKFSLDNNQKKLLQTWGFLL